MQRLRLLLAFWLAIAAMSASADSIPEMVKMMDGRTVKAMQVPRRASSDDYTYTYKGVKYTYISENNYTNF